MSDTIDLDFSDVSTPEPWEEGDKILEITSAAVKSSKDRKSKVLHLSFECRVPVEEDGKKIKGWVSLHKDALWSAKEFFAHVTRVKPDELENFQLNPEALVGETVGAVVTLQPSNKNPRRMVASIDGYFNPDTGPDNDD